MARVTSKRNEEKIRMKHPSDIVRSQFEPRSYNSVANLQRFSHGRVCVLLQR